MTSVEAAIASAKLYKTSKLCNIFYNAMSK